MNADKLLALHSVTEQMLVCALADQWDDLETLEVEQRHLAREAFVDGHDLAEEHRQLLAKTIALLDQVVTLAEANKREVVEQLKQLRKSNEMQNAYLQNSG